MTWSEWLYKGCPNVGDYIRVDCVGSVTKKSYTIEGLVKAVYNGTVLLIPAEPEEGCSATRWKKRIIPEATENRRQYENLSHIG